MRKIRSPSNVFLQHPADEASVLIAIDRQHGQQAQLKMGLVRDRDGLDEKHLVLFVRGSGKVFEFDRLHYLPACTPPFWWEHFRDGNQQTLQEVKVRLRYLGANTRHIADGDWERYRIVETKGPTNYTYFSQKIDIIETLKARLCLGLQIRVASPPALLVFMRECDQEVSDFARIYRTSQFEAEPLEWQWFTDEVDAMSRDESVKCLAQLGFTRRTAETAVRIISP